MSAGADRKNDFKNWFDHEGAVQLAYQIGAAYPTFPRETFVTAATANLESLEMTPRIAQFSEALRMTLPDDYPEALAILIASLPPAMSDCETFAGGWLQWPIGHYIAENGLDHYDASMAALTELTMRFTSEFAVRAFAARYPDRAYPDLMALSKHQNPHVRRWCSEGSRPRLPWGTRLNDLVKDPSPILPILDTLRDDSELYVRRSVANSLNDISKDHPELVVARCAAWRAERPSPELDWLIRHALRTLIKDGHPGALALQGFLPPENLEVIFDLTSDQVLIGDALKMKLAIHSASNRPQNLVVDFAIHYLRKNGTLSGKVFKWTTRSIHFGETVPLSKSHPFRQTSIRTLYPGPHRVEVLINGVSSGVRAFELIA